MTWSCKSRMSKHCPKWIVTLYEAYKHSKVMYISILKYDISRYVPRLIVISFLFDYLLWIGQPMCVVAILPKSRPFHLCQAICRFQIRVARTSRLGSEPAVWILGSVNCKEFCCWSLMGLIVMPWCENSEKKGVDPGIPPIPLLWFFGGPPNCRVFGGRFVNDVFPRRVFLH